MLYKCYGKTSFSLLKQKTAFFEENEKYLQRQKKIASLYREQPIRKRCKNCNIQLSLEYDFVKNNVEYVFCKKCSHLNGRYEDTNVFCEEVYVADSGKSYAKNYLEKNKKNYNYRLSTIYLPKAEFLYASIANDQHDPSLLSYLDFGAGVGYFVGALNKIGLHRILGTEVSKAQVEFGNSMLEEKLLLNHELDETISVLQETKSNVVSMIGVLEHLQNSRQVLQELKNNVHVKYIYISVPIFSLSVYLEILHPHIFNRHLSGGHTHLYTEESLLYMCKEFGFHKISQWWFGSDIVDLYRHVCVGLEQEKCSKNFKEKWRSNFMPFIDAMQLVLDKKHFASEIHMVLRKK